MAIGNLNTPITILEMRYVKDKDGFSHSKEMPIACVRAYKEDKNTTEKWSNRAMFHDASALFRIRFIQHTTITTDMKIECYSGRYEITSVENIRGKNMYIEILAKLEVKPSGQSDDEIT